MNHTGQARNKKMNISVSNSNPRSETRNAATLPYVNSPPNWLYQKWCAGWHIAVGISLSRAMLPIESPFISRTGRVPDLVSMHR